MNVSRVLCEIFQNFCTVARLDHFGEVVRKMCKIFYAKTYNFVMTLKIYLSSSLYVLIKFDPAQSPCLTPVHTTYVLDEFFGTNISFKFNLHNRDNVEMFHITYIIRIYVCIFHECKCSNTPASRIVYATCTTFLKIRKKKEKKRREKNSQETHSRRSYVYRLYHWKQTSKRRTDTTFFRLHEPVHLAVTSGGTGGARRVQSEQSIRRRADRVVGRL